MLRLQTRISTCIRSVATRIHAYAYPQKAKRAASLACKRILSSPCSIAYTSRHRFRRRVFQSFSRYSTKHTVGKPGHTETAAVTNATHPNIDFDVYTSKNRFRRRVVQFLPVVFHSLHASLVPRVRHANVLLRRRPRRSEWPSPYGRGCMAMGVRRQDSCQT